jgi:hypothetical protein
MRRTLNGSEGGTMLAGPKRRWSKKPSYDFRSPVMVVISACVGSVYSIVCFSGRVSGRVLQGGRDKGELAQGLHCQFRPFLRKAWASYARGCHKSVAFPHVAVAKLFTTVTVC